MTAPAEAVTLNLVRLALDAASLRHQAIAHNMANVNTPGFAPARVSFEQQLDGMRSALQQGQPLEASQLRGIQPLLWRDTPFTETDRTATLDLQAAELAQNTVHYQALLKALGKHMAILSAAVNEGKR